MAASLYISSSTSLALVDTQTGAKTVYLPDSKYLYGKTITIKDSGGSSAGNPIVIRPFSNDMFEGGVSIQNINTNYASLSFVAGKGKWYALQSISGVVINPGVSSLSSIVSYGLSTVARQPHTGVSSLSSIVSYGLSTIARQPHTGVSSLSSIVSYGLSSLVNGIVTMNGQLIINSNSSNPALTVNGKLNLIDISYRSNNSIYINSNILYYNNTIIGGSKQFQPQFITFS